MAKKPVAQELVAEKPRRGLWSDDAYREELFLEIVREVAEGKTLTRVCRDGKDKGYPSASRFLALIEKDPYLLKQYSRALQIRADINAETIVDIADEDTNIARARNRIDARRWHNEKLAPKKYGAKVLSENTTDINIRQRIDFSMIPSQIRDQLRRAMLMQIEQKTDG